MKKLKPDPNFTPCPVNDDDEIYPNGIFVFNITRIEKYITNNPGEIELVKANVSDFYHGFSKLNESHIDTVDISKPVILAEVAPGKYNLIDGHHRMEKARRMGIKQIPAYRLSVNQHMLFLITEKAYQTYIGYWNDKLS